MTKLNNSPDNLIKEVNKCLAKAVRRFCHNHSMFFNENSLQCYLYSVLNKNKHFSISNLIKTKDKIKTNLVHANFASIKKISKDKRRPCYDLGILNPKFIPNCNYGQFINKTTRDVKSLQNGLLAAFELKLIQKRPLKKELEKDYESLKYAKEAKWKYMVVFDSTKTEKDVFRGFKFDSNFRAIHIKIYFNKKNKKQIEVVIKPNNFLNLPTKWLKK